MIKIKGFHNYKINKFIQQINFWGLLPSIFLLFHFLDPVYFILSFLSIFFITKIGHTIGMHRYFCHRSFKTTIFKEKIISFLATLSTTSSIIYYTSVHRYHHIFSDKCNDIHDPKRLGFFKSFFFLIKPEDIKHIPIGIVKDLIRNKNVIFFHNWYWPTIISYILILFLIDPYLVLFCYTIPAGYSKFISGVQSTFSHMYGYQNFETKDNSTNNKFLNWITLGEGLHNNHHFKPNAYRHDFANKPGEFDIAGLIIEKLLIAKNSYA